jgi:hypothetical protein
VAKRFVELLHSAHAARFRLSSQPAIIPHWLARSVQPGAEKPLRLLDFHIEREIFQSSDTCVLPQHANRQTKTGAGVKRHFSKAMVLKVFAGGTVSQEDCA